MTQQNLFPPVVQCERCLVPLRINPERNCDARLLRHAKTPEGLCVNCATTQWFQGPGLIGELIKQHGPECLRLPHVQEQFAKIMAVGMADARPEEIDWERIVANWELPFPKIRKPGRRKKT